MYFVGYFWFCKDKEPKEEYHDGSGDLQYFFMLPWQFAQFVLLTQVSDGRDNKIINMLTHADVWRK